MSWSIAGKNPLCRPPLSDIQTLWKWAQAVVPWPESLKLHFTAFGRRITGICRDVGRSWPSQPSEHEEMDGMFLHGWDVPPHPCMWPPKLLPWERPFLEALHPRGCLFLGRGQHFIGPRGRMKLVAGWCSGIRFLGLDLRGNDAPSHHPQWRQRAMGKDKHLQFPTRTPPAACQE